MGYLQSFYNFLYLFDFLKTICRFFIFLDETNKKIYKKEEKKKGRDPKRPQELQGKTTQAGINLSLWHGMMKLEVT